MCKEHGKRNTTTMKPSSTYLLKVAGNKHEIDAAETQLGYTQEDVDEVPGVDVKKDTSKLVLKLKTN